MELPVITVRDKLWVTLIFTAILAGSGTFCVAADTVPPWGSKTTVLVFNVHWAKAAVSAFIIVAPVRGVPLPSGKVFHSTKVNPVMFGFVGHTAWNAGLTWALLALTVVFRGMRRTPYHVGLVWLDGVPELTKVTPLPTKVISYAHWA